MDWRIISRECRIRMFLFPLLMCFQSKRFVTNTDPGNRDPVVTWITAINCEKLFPLPIQWRRSRSDWEGEEEVVPVEQEASGVWRDIRSGREGNVTRSLILLLPLLLLRRTSSVFGAVDSASE